MAGTIESELGQMSLSFEKSAQGLLTVTSKESFKFLNGQYLKVLVKPTKRLSMLLNVDRELVAIFSNFSDQQARTVSIALHRRYLEKLEHWVKRV